MDFLTLDKIFVLDNLNIVLDKKYFVRADGRGISMAKIFKVKQWKGSNQFNKLTGNISLKQQGHS